MRYTRAVFVAVSCGAAALACGDIIGLNNYTDQDGSVLVDAGGSDAPTGDAKSDVNTNDAGTCGAGFACVPALPAGWAWAVYSADSRPACATGYGAPSDVEEGIDAGAATCGCGCTTTDPTCASTVAITAGTNGACNNTTTQTDPADASCNVLTTSVNTFANGSNISVTGPAPSGGSCAPTPSQTLPGVGYAHQGRTCAYDAGAQGSCAGGTVCVANPAPFATCVSQVGDNACPTAFPNQHFVGTTLDDTRGCTACTCTFDAGACGGSTTFYVNNNCTNKLQKIPVDGVCTGASAHTWTSFTYAPVTSASCAGSTTSPDGGVVFGDLTTVCCQ